MPGAAIATRQIALERLELWPGNPRRGDLQAIRDSLQANGQYRALVVQASTMRVLGGNHTLLVMRELGWAKALCHLVDVDDRQARRIVLADNRTAQLGGFDERELADLLGTLDGDLGGSGYDQASVAELLATLEPEQAATDTAPGEPPEKPRTKPGEVWALGEHRLLCGDATKREDVAALMGTERAQLMVSDPPYGVAFGGDRGKNAISGDLTQAAIPVSFVLALEVLCEDARIYLFGGTGNWGMYAGLFDAHLHMQVRPIAWVKGKFVLRPSNYHSAFEIVYFGWKGRGGTRAHWYGDRKQSDVWRVDRDPTADKQHPTQKPVQVCEIPVRNSCAPGAVVYDPFVGSGSTLIACENLHRRCLAMEIDPGYCDVVIDRWQRHTGAKALRHT